MQELLPLVSYALVSSITPGPNNIMLTASGISFGIRKTIPHMLGIPFGFGIQLALCAYGLGEILLHVPAANIGLKLFGTAYLLYLAWTLRVNLVSSNKFNDGGGKPMSFINAALFQFANPKAWVMAVTGASVFLPPYQPFALSVAVWCVVFCLINLPCVGMWAILGSVVKARLNRPAWQKGFSSVIVALTLYAAIAVWL
jgi:threonine/homoserine/homoserine lactone efflux protein